MEDCSAKRAKRSLSDVDDNKKLNTDELLHVIASMQRGMMEQFQQLLERRGVVVPSRMFTDALCHMNKNRSFPPGDEATTTELLQCKDLRKTVEQVLLSKKRVTLTYTAWTASECMLVDRCQQLRALDVTALKPCLWTIQHNNSSEAAMKNYVFFDGDVDKYVNIVMMQRAPNHAARPVETVLDRLEWLVTSMAPGTWPR